MKETIVGRKALKVKFEQDGQIIKMQILEQDEKLRGQGLIKYEGEYSIKSISNPAIGLRTLYIRGSLMSADRNKKTTIFSNEEQVTKYINEISKLINEINDEAEEKERKTNKSIIINTDGYKVVIATLYDENGEQLRKETAKCSPEDTYDFETGATLAFERLIEKSSEKIIVGDETLKVEFTRYGKEVTAKVLEMDESMRGNGGVMEGNGYRIKSILYPQIISTALLIRGKEKSKDHTEPKYAFDSVTKAKEYIENISELILRINAEHKWNAKVVCVKSHDRDTFTKGKIYIIENGKLKDDRGIYAGNYKSVDEVNKAWTTAKFIEVVE